VFAYRKIGREESLMWVRGFREHFANDYVQLCSWIKQMRLRLVVLPMNVANGLEDCLEEDAVAVVRVVVRGDVSDVFPLGRGSQGVVSETSSWKRLFRSCESTMINHNKILVMCNAGRNRSVFIASVLGVVFFGRQPFTKGTVDSFIGSKINFADTQHATNVQNGKFRLSWVDQVTELGDGNDLWSNLVTSATQTKSAKRYPALLSSFRLPKILILAACLSTKDVFVCFIHV
jgi:hypothetical protein